MSVSIRKLKRIPREAPNELKRLIRKTRIRTVNAAANEWLSINETIKGYRDTSYDRRS